MIHNTQGKLDTGWIADVYGAVGAGDAFRALEDKASVKSIMEWLTQEKWDGLPTCPTSFPQEKSDGIQRRNHSNPCG